MASPSAHAPFAQQESARLSSSDFTRGTNKQRHATDIETARSPCQEQHTYLVRGFPGACRGLFRPPDGSPVFFVARCTWIRQDDNIYCTYAYYISYHITHHILYYIILCHIISAESLRCEMGAPVLPTGQVPGP